MDLLRFRIKKDVFMIWVVLVVEGSILKFGCFYEKTVFVIVGFGFEGTFVFLGDFSIVKDIMGSGDCVVVFKYLRVFFFIVFF